MRPASRIASPTSWVTRTVVTERSAISAASSHSSARAHVVQRALIEHVLLDAEIGVERAALEDDAELGERRAALPCHVMAKNADGARPAGVAMGDDGKERALARAVEAEQNRERRGRDRKTHVVEGLPGAIGVRDMLDGERSRRERRVSEGRVRVHCLVIATPQG